MKLIKKLLRAYQRTKHKDRIFKRTIQVLRKEGLGGLKRAINGAYENGEKQEMELYQFQQSKGFSNDFAERSVLFVVLVEDVNIDSEETLMSIGQLKNINKREVVLAPRGYQCAQQDKVIEVVNDWTMHLKKLLAFETYDYVFFIKNGDVVAPNMAYEFWGNVSESGLPLLYSDECIGKGEAKVYMLKAKYSLYEWLLQGKMGRAVAFPRELILPLLEKAVTDTTDSLIFSLSMLAVFEAPVKHVEKVLLLRQDETIITDARVKFINECLQDIHCELSAMNSGNHVAIIGMAAKRKYSIIVNDTGALIEALDDIIKKTQYVEREIIAITSDADNYKAAQALYAGDKKICILQADGSFSERNNIGAGHANGDVLVFYDSANRILDEAWLYQFDKMFAFEYIAAISPKIIRPENTIKYAGLLSGGFGFTPILFNGDENVCVEGWNDPAFRNREVSILSATCIAVRKEIFEKIGGFDSQNTPQKFSNVTLSYEIERLGYACFYCADVTLTSYSQNWYDSFYDQTEKGVCLHLLKKYAAELSEDLTFTDTMIRQYLRGVPQNIKIYARKSSEKKNILMVSHDSLIGGATIALEYAAKVLQNQGYYVLFLLPGQGGIEEELKKDDVPYIIDSTVITSTRWLEYAQDFDLIFVSTIVMGNKVSELMDCNKEILWWIHEASEYYENYKYEIDADYDKLHVYCGGQLALNNFKQNYKGIEPKNLIYGVPDYNSANKSKTVAGEPFIFYSIGTIERRKGQDILVEAIKKIPDAKKKQCKFRFIGRPVQDDIFKAVSDLHMEYPEMVEILEPVNREKLMDMYREADCVICSSREDPMPVFITEAMLMNKVTICSANTGSASLIKNGYNGYVYENNDPAQLAEKIELVLEHPELLEDIGKHARETYKQHLSLEQFEKNIIEEIRGII